MLVSKRLLSRIDEIVDRAYLAFALTLIGLDGMSDDEKFKLQSQGILAARPMMELLYLLARRSELASNLGKETLNEALIKLPNAQLPIINDESQYTLDHAKAQVKQALDNTKHELKSRVKQEILIANSKTKEAKALSKEERKMRPGVPQLIERIGKIIVGGAIAAIFVKELVTTMTNTINSSVVDELRMKALMGQKNPSDVLVYKQVVWDNRLSAECKKLHTHPNGAPRIFTLGELQENGSNAGRRKSEWKATISGTHPNCRCQLKQATMDIIGSAK